MEFAPFFENPAIKKVWHNYGFDSHAIENYGIRVSGFHADTMHMSKLWNSSRGGYSLEALTKDPMVMNYEGQSPINMELIGKLSIKTIFGKKKLKKDGQIGKIITLSPLEELQREEQNLWICYSALDSMSTLQLFESLKSKLKSMVWIFNSERKGSMYEFYEQYWRPFGELLVRMEAQGMRSYLADNQKVPTSEQKTAANRFRNWAARYCPDAMHMNVGSDMQLRQLYFGGIQNSKNPNEFIPLTRTFKLLNTEGIIEEGKKAPSKFVNIVISSLGVKMTPKEYTHNGWPSVSGVSLKKLAGKVSSECDWIDEEEEEDVGISGYGTAYKAFVENNKGDKEGKEACHAIAALCDACSINSVISNNILPLQNRFICAKRLCKGQSWAFSLFAEYKHRDGSFIHKET